MMNNLQILVLIRYSLIFICFFIRPVHAQLVQSNRIEIPSNASVKEEFEVFPLRGAGLLSVIHETEFQSAKGSIWQFAKYDSTLNQIWKNTQMVARKYTPVMSYISDQLGYWLFEESETGSYLIIQLNIQDGLVSEFKCKLLSNLDIRQFKVIGSKVLISGYYQSKPVVLVHSLFDQTLKVLPGLYEKNTEIHNVDIDNESEVINVLTYSYRKSKCYFEIRTFNFEGKFLNKTSITDSKYSIISGQIVPFNQDYSYLIGNYSVGCTAYSQGIYIANIGHERPNSPHFVEFTDMKNFFNYLKPKRRAKILERYVKRKSMGKENKLRYRLLIHDLIQTVDEIILVAEIYYPNPKANNANYGNIDSRMYNALRTSDSYRYTHVVICAFDREGNFKWDNSVGIPDVVSSDLQPMVQVTPIDDYFVLAYPHEGKIRTSIIKKGEEVLSNETFELVPSSTKEKVLNSEREYIIPWFGNHFISYGTQNLGTSIYQAGREVFYINNLTYQLNSNERD
jgi:hypothetical protein